MDKVKAVIFDLDGVLIEAKDWHYEALNRALGLLGYSISRYDHLVTYDGLPTRRKLEMLSQERGLPRQLHGFLNDMKQKYFVQTAYQECRPLFQHEYALSRLQAEGYRLAVASNSIRMTIELMLEQANIIDYFEFILSNQDVENSKPDPEMYQTACSKLGLDPCECLVVEDNENGIQAAKSAGTELLVVQEVTDVTYGNISKRIAECEEAR